MVNARYIQSFKHRALLGEYSEQLINVGDNFHGQNSFVHRQEFCAIFGALENFTSSLFDIVGQLSCKLCVSQEYIGFRCLHQGDVSKLNTEGDKEIRDAPKLGEKIILAKQIHF